MDILLEERRSGKPMRAQRRARGESGSDSDPDGLLDGRAARGRGPFGRRVLHVRQAESSARSGGCRSEGGAFEVRRNAGIVTAPNFRLLRIEQVTAHGFNPAGPGLPWL